jgi:uncharacterized protein DUF4153
MASRPPEIPEVLQGLDAPEATRTTLLALVALGAAFDLTFNGQRPGVSVPIFALILAVSLRFVLPRAFGTDLLLAGAVGVSVFPALIASPQLAGLDILAASGLIGLAATQDLEPITFATVVGLVHRGLTLLRRALGVPSYVAAPFARPANRGRLRTTLRVALIAAPILIVFAALLSSGDRVFGRLVSSFLPEWNVASFASHIVVTIVGAILVAILWRAGLGRERAWEVRPTPLRAPVLSFPEWCTVLFGIDLLFGVFVVVQFAYLFGGHHRVRVTPGLTYAEYARSGFFQLGAVAALTVLVIMATWDWGRRDHRGHERTFRALVTAMVALSGVVLASALKRLALYEGTFGFTINRFFGYVAIATIGAVLLVLTAAIWTRHRERLIAGFLAVGFVALVAVNVLNPDRFVASHNLSRFEAIHKVDAAYLAVALGPDALPMTIDLLPALTPTERVPFMDALCAQLRQLGPEPSWRSDNLGRAEARRALVSARITLATCANKPDKPLP